MYLDVPEELKRVGFDARYLPLMQDIYIGQVYRMKLVVKYDFITN